MRKKLVRSVLFLVSVLLVALGSAPAIYAANKSWNTQTEWATWLSGPAQALSATSQPGSLALTPAINSIAQTDGTYTATDGSAVWDAADGLVYTFSARAHNSIIQTFNPTDNTFTTLSAALPSGRDCTSAVWDASTGTAYIFGGLRAGQVGVDEIVSYVPATDVVSVVGHLPSARGCVATAWDQANRTAYVFGGFASGASSGDFTSVVTFDASSNTVSTAGTIPGSDLNSIAVAWDPTTSTAYLFGGYYTFASAAPYQTDAVYSYHAGTTTLLGHMAVPIHGATAVYDVPTKEAYVFGGMQYDGSSVTDVHQTVTFKPTGSVFGTAPALTSDGGAYLYAAVAWDSTNRMAYIANTDGITKYRIPPSGMAVTQVDAGAAAVWHSLSTSETLNGGSSAYYVRTSSSGCSLDNTSNFPTTWNGWTQLSFSSGVSDLSSLSTERYLCVGVALDTLSTSSFPQIDTMSISYDMVPPPPTATPTPTVAATSVATLPVTGSNALLPMACGALLLTACAIDQLRRRANKRNGPS